MSEDITETPAYEFTRYDADTGRILFMGNCSEAELNLHESQGPLVLGLYDTRYFYIAKVEHEGEMLDQALERPAMPLVYPDLEINSDGNDELIIQGVPINTYVNIRGPSSMSGTTSGEDIVLTFTLTGKYMVELTNFPYRDERLEVNAI